MKKRFFFALLWLVLFILQCSAQNKRIDSLLIIFKTERTDTSKVKHACNLCVEYRNIGLYDTALYYGNTALALAQKLNFKKGISISFNCMGTVKYLQGDFSKALDYYLKTLKIYEELKDKKGIGKILGNLGTVYYSKGDYQKALETYSKSLEIDRELGNKKGIASNLGNIGLVYSDQGYYPKALDDFLKALKINEDLGYNRGVEICLGNIGLVYYAEGEYNQALNYYKRALKISEELGDKNGVETWLSDIGKIYSNLADYSKALDFYNKSLKIAEGIGEKELIEKNLSYIGAVYGDKKDYSKALDFFFKAIKIAEETGEKYDIATLFVSIGELYTATGKFKEAEQYLKRAAILDDSIGSMEKLMFCEKQLSRLYDTTGRPKLALIHYKKAIAIKDTIFSQENSKQLVRKEMNFEFDKKELAAKADQDKKDLITAADEKKQLIIIRSVVIGLLLMMVFAAYIFITLRLTRKQKNLIEAQKNEVSHQKDEAETQKEKAEEQKEIAFRQRIIADELREISEKQKHLVEEKQKEIVDSITYARRIQRALLTSDEYFNKHLPAEHFILFKPKDIVSGDFYWGLSIPPYPNWDRGTNKIKLPPETERQNIFYLVTADCTGHGVPGAFMSMLNISYLNENVIERSIRLPHDILNTLRKEIIQALNPAGSIEESKDGMDCTLCVYDFDKMLLHFSAANNPLWLVRGGELTEYKADKMPVGKYSEKTEPFSMQTIPLQKGDIIYTSTDGFADQFGRSGKKLMKKTFKEELLKINQQPMAEQKEYLNHFFENWKGNNEQVDDVCVIGVRI